MKNKKNQETVAAITNKNEWHFVFSAKDLLSGNCKCQIESCIVDCYKFNKEEGYVAQFEIQISHLGELDDKIIRRIISLPSAEVLMQGITCLGLITDPDASVNYKEVVEYETAKDRKHTEVMLVETTFEDLGVAEYNHLNELITRVLNEYLSNNIPVILEQYFRA